MFQKVTPKRDPELDYIRNSVLNKKSDLETVGLNLAKECQHLHSSFLFHPEGRPALKQLCTVLSSTSAGMNSHINSWKDLASFLGLTFHQIGCIENYKYEDSTELVLKTYTQRKDATLDVVIKAFLQLERLDVISSIEQYIEELVKYTRRHLRAKPEIESGYYSMSDGSSGDGILRPEGYKNLNHQLPITLKELISGDISVLKDDVLELNENLKLEVSLQQSSIIKQRYSQKKCSKRVMLTFAKDGESMAKEIAYEFRRPRNGNLPIGVLILDDHPDKIHSNAERFIIHMFAKMDFIIPIVTEGYLNTLGKKPDFDTSFASCIDPLYVQLIHDLMSKYYCRNQCRNDKIRCIIPNEQLNSVMLHPHKKLDPVLNVFLKYSELNELILRILKYKRTK